MADVDIGTLEAVLRLRDEMTPAVRVAMDNLSKSMSQGEKATEGISTASMAAGSAIGNFLGNMATQAVAGLTNAAWDAVASVEELASRGEKLANMSAVLGIGVESLQRFERAAQDSGGSLEQLSMGIIRMQRSAAEGGEGFAKLGLNAKEFANMGAEEAVKTLADQLDKMENAGQRNAAMQGVLGRSGAMLVPVLKAIADGAGDVKVVIGEGDVQALADLDDAIDRAKGAWTDFKEQMVLVIARSPELRNAIDMAAQGLLSLIPAAQQAINFIINGFMNTNAVLTAWAQGILTVVSSIVGGFMEMNRIMGDAVSLKMNPVAAFESLKTVATSAFEGVNAGIQRASDYTIEWKDHTVALKGELGTKGEGGIVGAVGEIDEAYMAIADAVRNGNQFMLEQQHAAMSTNEIVGKRIPLEESILAYKEAEIQLQNLQTDALDAMVPVLAGMLGISEDMAKAFLGYPPAIEEATEEASKLESAFADMAESVLQTLINGGNIGDAISNSLGSIGKNIGQDLGKSLGGVLGSVMGPIGGALGGLLGKGVGKLFGGLFGNKEIMEVNDLRDAFFEAHGGFEALSQQLAVTGDAGLIKKIFDAKTVEDFNALVSETTGVLGLHDLAFDSLIEATGRWGLELGQLGPEFAQQAIHEQLVPIWQDFQLLTEAGADVNAVIAAMGPELVNLVNQAMASGAALPASMRPMIDALIQSGQLVDENGVAFTSAEEAGLSFTETLEESVGSLVDSIKDLVAALTGIPNVSRTVTIDTRTTGAPTPGGGAPDDGDHQTGPGFATGTGGFRDFGAGTLGVLHGVEAVVRPGDPVPQGAGGSNAEMMGAMGAQTDAIKALPAAIGRATRDAVLLGIGG